jgi:hypothetical protein
MYCPHCGNPQETPEENVAEGLAEAAHEEGKAEVEVSDREVEIARINAKRDIDLAKIQRGIIENEAIQEAEVATAEAEAVTDALAPEPSETPVVVADPGPPPEEDTAALPPAEESSEPSSDEPGSKSKSTGYGNPLFFG